ncbi:hypothetical protein H4R34_004957 [Dimargaris verticillata]|uniref:Protein kinase domain-containing protein n=1 Tax=Dimargaris verticillata TaxID=2761393 RepID=A0A9W8B3V9_9FUNG|nr:hypothetical protein H4R34_004957 [Dimargaris verticillata]
MLSGAYNTMYAQSPFCFGTGIPDFRSQFFQPLPSPTPPEACPRLPAALRAYLQRRAQMPTPTKIPQNATTPPSKSRAPASLSPAAFSPASGPKSASSSLSRGFVGFVRRNSARKPSDSLNDNGASLGLSSSNASGLFSSDTTASSRPSLSPAPSPLATTPVKDNRPHHHAFPRPPPIQTKDLSASPLYGTLGAAPVKGSESCPAPPPSTRVHSADPVLRNSGGHSGSMGAVSRTPLGFQPPNAPARSRSLMRRTDLYNQSDVMSQPTRHRAATNSFTAMLMSPPDSTTMSPAMEYLSSLASSSPAPSCSLWDEEGQIVDQFIVGPVIGHGGFSVVREVYTMDPQTHSTQKLAAKIVRKDRMEDADQEHVQDSLQHEVRLLRRLSHPNILRHVDTIETPLTTVIITELCAQGNLLDYIGRHGSPGLPEACARSLFVQIARGVHYLHTQAGVVHRDLKLDNVLLDDEHAAKLCDFGLSQPLMPLCVQCKPEARCSPCRTRQPSFIQAAADGPQDNAPSCHGDGEDRGTSNAAKVDEQVGGSLAYCAPEQLRASYPLCSPATDVWALGIILYAMLLGTLPFNDDYEPRLVMHILNRSIHQPFDHLSPDLVALIDGMLAVDPTARWTLGQILNCSWCQTE